MKLFRYIIPALVIKKIYTNYASEYKRRQQLTDEQKDAEADARADA